MRNRRCFKLTALYVILSIFAFFILIGFVRVGAKVRYSESGLEVWAKFGIFRKKIVSPKKERPKQPKEPKKPKEKKGNKPKLEESTEKGGGLDQLKQYYEWYAKPTIEFVKGFCGSIRVKILRVNFIAAAKDDSAAAAMMYGRAWSVAGMITPLLEKNKNVKKYSYNITVDYAAEKATVYFETEMTIRIGRVMHLAARLLVKVLPKIIKNSKKGGAKDGKTNS